MPELPIEFYEHNALLKIGRAIGPILRIDANTANGVRGRFPRLCVQGTWISLSLKLFILGSLSKSFNMRVLEPFALNVGESAIIGKSALSWCEF